MLYRNIFLTTLVVTLLSCSENEEKSITNIPEVISIKSIKPELLYFSETVDSIAIIPLETKRECMIGRVTQIKVQNERIYIFDERLDNSLTVFDMKGNFLFKLNNKGKGPREFVNLSGFCITPGGDIALSDLDGKKVLLFNSDGIFLNEFYPEFYPTDIASISENVFAITTYQPDKRVIVMDRSGKTLFSGRYDFPGIYKQYNNEIVQGHYNVLFREYYCDTIFRVDSNGIEAKYFVDFGDMRFTRQNYIDLPIVTRNGITSKPIPKGFRYGNYNLIETNSELCFYFWESGHRRNFWCKFNLESKETSVYEINAKSDDILFTNITQRIQAQDGKYLFYLVDSYSFVQNTNRHPDWLSQIDPKYTSMLRTVMDQVTLQSNPMLVMFRFSGENI